MTTRVSDVTSPKFFVGPDLLTLSEQQYFVWDTVSLSTKLQDMLEIWRCHSLHDPRGYTRERNMTLTQQWQYLNLTRNSFHTFFPAKGIVSYRQIISSLLYVRLKGTC